MKKVFILISIYLFFASFLCFLYLWLLRLINICSFVMMKIIDKPQHLFDRKLPVSARFSSKMTDNLQRHRQNWIIFETQVLTVVIVNHWDYHGIK